MALTRERVSKALDFVEQHHNDIIQAKELFTINEGELKPFVERALANELDYKAFERARKRIAPINVLKKIVDKLSTLYTKEVNREVEEGQPESNQEIVDWYVKTLHMDPKMVCSQKQFNVNKYTALEPYIDVNEEDPTLRVPKLRVLPAHTFMVYSDDSVDPTKPTIFIKILGMFNKNTGELTEDKQPLMKTVNVYMLYDEDNIIAVDSDREVRPEFMGGNEEGINPYGMIPFVYINQSEFSLLPNPDTDTMPMSVLIPLLLTDLNYATQFMSHSIIYAIDADIENVDGNPDAIWHIKSDLNADGASQSKATLGTIKPEVDIDKVLKLIETQLRMWLDTKNIKARSVGNLNIENAPSGIAKMIDSSDTTEARQEQETLYQAVERRFWKLIGVMHNVWLESGARFEENRRIIDTLNVTTTFEEQEVVIDDEKKLREIKLKLDNGLTSKRRALKEANPELDETEIDELLEEIRQEKEEQTTFNLSLSNEDTRLDSDNNSNQNDNLDTSEING